MRNSVTIPIVGALLALIAGCAPKSSQSEGGMHEAAAIMMPSPVERGKYLAMTIACGDCHTPFSMAPGEEPMPDSTRLFSGAPEGAPYPVWTPADMEQRQALGLFGVGHSYAGPWGVSFSANITPDTATGIGEWTEGAFIQALRTGKHQGQPDGRPIMPPMPWPSYTNLTDSDLKALWAYLRTIPPVANQVPLPVPPPMPPAMEMMENE